MWVTLCQEVSHSALPYSALYYLWSTRSAVTDCSDVAWSVPSATESASTLHRLHIRSVRPSDSHSDCRLMYLRVSDRKMDKF